MNALYIAASGMVAQNQSMSLIGANLANANSPGYLSQVGSMVEFPTGVVTRQGHLPSAGGIGVTGQGVAFTAGLNLGLSGMQTTGQMTNLAVNGPGFFAVRGPQGVAYTRNGNFTVDSTGTLVTGGGERLLYTNGKPVVVGTAPFSVSPSGVVSQGGTALGQIAVFGLPAGNIKTLGAALYQTAGATPLANPILQGSLNTSNVNIVNQTVDLVSAQSSYQSLAAVVNEESTRMKAATALGVLA